MLSARARQPMRVRSGWEQRPHTCATAAWVIDASSALAAAITARSLSAAARVILSAFFCASCRSRSRAWHAGGE
eukprot:3613194-Prymnesium_polylepis.1